MPNEITKIEQLKKWVNGISIHRGTAEDGECCPDFSCCQPELLAPKEERELFAELFFKEDSKEYEKMLMMFLGRAIPLMTDKKVYIAGGKD